MTQKKNRSVGTVLGVHLSLSYLTTNTNTIVIVTNWITQVINKTRQTKL